MTHSFVCCIEGQLSLSFLRVDIDRVPACLAGIKAGRVYLCRVVVGNIV